MSCDNEATRGFGPLLPGHLKVDFGDANALERIFRGTTFFFSNLKLFIFQHFYGFIAESGDQIAGFLFEPIQGEAGVTYPDISELCSILLTCNLASTIKQKWGNIDVM